MLLFFLQFFIYKNGNTDIVEEQSYILFLLFSFILCIMLWLLIMDLKKTIDRSSFQNPILNVTLNVKRCQILCKKTIMFLEHIANCADNTTNLSGINNDCFLFICLFICSKYRDLFLHLHCEFCQVQQIRGKCDRTLKVQRLRSRNLPDATADPLKSCRRFPSADHLSEKKMTTRVCVSVCTAYKYY